MRFLLELTLKLNISVDI